MKWFGHASFSITDLVSGTKIYYIDPFELPQNQEKGDLIFITHAHPDHLSTEDITPLLKEDSVVIATLDCLEDLDIPQEQKQAVAANTFYTVKGVPFSAVPAYNTHPDRLNFHPKEKGWVGYIITVNNQKIYHAGDTDFIPEMNDLAKENLDIAMLPIGGTYTMDADEAIKAANAIKAKITIPIHYRRLLGDQAKSAEEKFKRGVTESKVVVLKEIS